MPNISKKFLISSFLILVFWILPDISKWDWQSIKLDFCDWIDANLPVQIQPWETKEICLSFTSKSQSKEKVTYWFMEWYMPAQWTQVCKLEQWIDWWNAYSNLFSNNEWNQRTFILEPGEVKIVKEKINVPIWKEWMTYWCIVHKTETIDKEWWMFNIVVLMQRYFNLFVWWNAEINNSIKLLKVKSDVRSSNRNLWIKINWDKISTNFLIKNDWNISQTISIKWTIYNALWFEKEFEIPATTLSPWIETNIESESFLIPSYKWFFTISSEIISEPKFEFNPSEIDDALKQPKTIEESSKIFLFSRIRLIIWTVALIIIIMLLRPLLKKHHQE